MGVFIFFIVISIPILYIFGLVSFIQLLTRWLKSPTQRRADDLKRIITQLAIDIQNNPKNKQLPKTLKLYQEELDSLQINEMGKLLPQAAHTINAAAMKAGTKQTVTTPPPTPSQSKKGKKEKTPSLSSWYSDNSINALLYLGAFLIVASAITFVSFQWEALSGFSKAALLSTLNAAFLGAGIYTYRFAKVRQAGVTFTFISAALIPFSGAAWYNFYWHEFGLVWTITSVVALVTYLYLARHLHNRIFTYLIALSVYSISASLISTSHLSTSLYMLTGVFSALIIQAYRTIQKNHASKNISYTATIDDDLQTSADTIAFFSLLYGILYGFAHHTFFSLEMTMTVLTVTVYFVAMFIESKLESYMTFIELLVPLFFGIFVGWQEVPALNVSYLFTLLSITYLILVYYQKDTQTTYTDTALAISFFMGIIVYIASHSVTQIPLHWVRLGCTPLVYGITIAYLKRQPLYFLLTSLLSAFILHTLFVSVLILPSQPYLVLTYLTLGIIAYVYAVLASKAKLKLAYSIRTTTLLTCIWFFVINFITIDGEPMYLMIAALTLSLIFAHAAFVFSHKALIYCSNVALTLYVLESVAYFSTSPVDQPFVFTIAFLGMYCIAQFVPPSVKRYYERSAYIGLVLTALSFMGSNDFSALIPGYVGFGISLFEAWKLKTVRSRYIASAIGMLMYLWQMSFWNYEETQVYTLPLALYFLVIGYIESRRDNASNAQILDLIGFIILIVPTLNQALDYRGAFYALLLGAEGILLLIIANTIESKMYRYAGTVAIVLAVVSQIYEYVFSLPRWIIFGSVGLVFLIGAVYLLVKRPEKL